VRISPTIIRAESAAPVAPAPRLELQKPFGWSYLPLRMIAFGIDVAVHLSAAALALIGAFAGLGNEPYAIFESGVLEPALLAILATAWVMATAQEVILGTTPGKRIVGLKLHGSGAAIFMRAFFFAPSCLFLGVGLLWALFNRERRCWHDVAADVQPMYRPSDALR